MLGVTVRPELFLAYADSDREWVQGFFLPEIGLAPDAVVTPDDFRPGVSVIRELERLLTAAHWTVLVLSPAFGASPLSVLTELLASHDSFSQDAGRLIPVLIEPYDLPLHLDFRVRLDCTDRSRWPSEAGRLRDLLKLGFPRPEQLACPYPGLVEFGPQQAGLFFGRDQESDQISRLIRQHSFLLVVGPSGSGKSSLVAAGVLPRLETADGDRWLVRVVRPGPGAAPLASLLGESAPGPGIPMKDRVAGLLAAKPEARRLLLFIDQAEAIFLLPLKQDRDQYLALIGELRQAGSCAVVLALRADFYGELIHSSLWPVSQGERLEIAPLRGAALREAIVAPAGAVGAHIEPVLLERLLHDAGEEPGGLPLIQETMVLLWERRDRQLLTLSAYESLGGAGRSGLAAALATRANAALAALPAGQQQIAQRIFVRLVQHGEGRPDTRRRQPVSALRVPGEDLAAFDTTMAHLSSRRLLTTGRLDGGEPCADLGHEALIAHWPTLRDWIAESRTRETVRRRIERDAAEWQRLGRDPGDLYRRRRLAEALDVTGEPERDLSEVAIRFLTAGRRRRLAGRLALGLALVLALTGVAWLARTPVRDAWLKHEALAASPQVPVAGGQVTVAGRDRAAVALLLADVHEVTNQQYRYCVQALRCAAPDEPFGNAKFANGDRSLPVVFVTAYDAAAFCSWLGRRLPTEAQWDLVAYGPGGRLYPWGNKRPVPGQVNAIFGRHVPSGLVAADSDKYLSGDSQSGVRQLLGNAAEWTSTLLGGNSWNGKDRVRTLLVMGGGYYEDPPVATASPDTASPDSKVLQIGFRCVTRK